MARLTTRKCDDFVLCIATGKQGYKYEEDHLSRRSIYNYFVYGSGVINGEYVPERTLYDVKSHLYRKVEYIAQQDFYMIAYNVFDKEDADNWSGAIIDNSFTCNANNSHLLCLDGNPIVNGVELKRYSHSKLERNKHYDITMNGGVLAIFDKYK